MPSSTALVVAKSPKLAVYEDEFSVPLLRIQQFHTIAKRAGEQMATAAVCAGLELLALQKELKRTDTSVSFEQFLTNRAEDLGFGARTGFRYTALASSLKSKLLKTMDGRIVALLDRAPSAMSEREAEILGAAVRKSIEGASLSELYEELGITRRKHAPPVHDHQPHNLGDMKPVPIEQQVQEQMEFFARFSAEIEKTVTLGQEKVLLISRWPLDQVDSAIAIHRRNLEVLETIRKARKK